AAGSGRPPGDVLLLRPDHAGDAGGPAGPAVGGGAPAHPGARPAGAGRRPPGRGDLSRVPLLEVPGLPRMLRAVLATPPFPPSPLDSGGRGGGWGGLRQKAPSPPAPRPLSTGGEGRVVRPPALKPVRRGRGNTGGARPRPSPRTASLSQEETRP